MDKLSELLQEAKPLYIERKRRRNMVRNASLAIMAFILCSLAILPFTINNNSDDYYCQSTTSIVEQMGLPTDDYGLLKVD